MATESLLINVYGENFAGNFGSIGFTPLAGNTIIRQPWPIPGDVTFDCKVNILDLLSVRSKLGQDTGSGGNCIMDVNQDGKINILDLILIRGWLNTRCEP